MAIRHPEPFTIEGEEGIQNSTRIGMDKISCLMLPALGQGVHLTSPHTSTRSRFPRLALESRGTADRSTLHYTFGFVQNNKEESWQ